MLRAVAVLAELEPARYEHDGLGQLEGRDDGADARVGEDDIGGTHACRELLRTEEPLESDLPGLVDAVADLREDIASAASPGPLVHALDQALEGELSTDRHEDQSTVPANSGPCS